MERKKKGECCRSARVLSTATAATSLFFDFLPAFLAASQEYEEAK